MTTTSAPDDGAFGTDYAVDRARSIPEHPSMAIEGGTKRVGIGCGSAFGFAVMTIVITFAGVFVHSWLDPSYGGRGAGQGEGIIGGMVLLATPIVGLAAAWRPLAGLVIGGLALVALLALHIPPIVM